MYPGFQRFLGEIVAHAAKFSDLISEFVSFKVGNKCLRLERKKT